MRRPPFLVVVLSLGATLFASLPIGYLAIRFIEGLDQALDEVFRFRTLELLANTGLLVLSVSISAFVVGFSQAWLTTRSNIRFASMFAVLAALPLAIPSYVMALGYVSVFPAFSGFFASWLVLTLATSPYVFLAVTASLMRVDTAGEEVARSLGFGRFSVLRKVTWPQVAPAATASVLLVALYTLSEFGAIAILRYDTFTRAIFNAYRGSFDRTAAAALAIILLLITLLVIWLERRYRGVNLSSSRALGKRVRVELGNWSWIALPILVLVAALGVGLPIVSLTIWSIQGGTSIDIGQLLEALWGSFSLAGLAGVVIGIFATAIALWAVRYRTKLGAFIETLAWATHALPAIVVGLALVFFGANITPWIYQTTWLLLIGYLILFLPNALAAISSPIARVPRSLEDLSQSLGTPANRTLFKIVLPIAMPGIIAGMALVSLTVLKELPATLLLRPTEVDTLATRLWSATENLSYSQAAPYAMLLIMLAGLPALALNAQARKAISEVRAK
ncbi:iron ABC transporter permease [Candidatus Aquiluna sp. UB-MaderosW2red]|uniref:ABC transporter permease n=1 Tax=Candidatus Aquiluna sp. UB-MaderosW2red TaxID=1855377 RepID=UPI000875DF74|nr:iron ABC transporter permease [Candidatus Aquiluna sp. UB-MaderosW2red]SCX08001.1 iron(III) transport system permease protein [Candidatus Aquiluna sp. UB-MaderosW2red]